MILTRSVRRAILGSAAAATAVLLASCSAAPAEPSGTDSGPVELQPLTIAIGAAGTYVAPLFLANVQGYAEEEGLDLDIQTVGTNVLNVVLAGQADIGPGGVGQSLPPIGEGKGTNILYALESGAVSATVVGTDGIDSMEDCTKVITSPQGSSAYSATLAYLDALDSDAAVTAVPTLDAIIPSLLSGEQDCAVNATSTFVGKLSDGLHVIVDPQDEDTMPTTLPLESTGIILWGIDTHLAEISDKVEALMRAMVKAEDFLATASDDEIVDALTNEPNLAAFTPDALASAFQGDKPFLVPNGGIIDEATWKNNLELYAFSFPQIAEGDSIWDFENVVDSSFIEAAK
jgi:ABC-type nitrate/sulfonate/bicarbonate transport system substrate-binding protein